MKALSGEMIRLAQARMRPADIADALNVRPDQVYRHLCEARARGVDIPRHPGGRRNHLVTDPPLTIAVPIETAIAVAGHAKRRGLSPVALFKKILDAVVRDNLIDAVLDEPL